MEKTFDGSCSDGSGRYKITWANFNGNEPRTACTWYKLASTTRDQRFNLFEFGSPGSRRRFAHGSWATGTWVTHTWGDYPYGETDDDIQLDLEWHHACVTWDGSTMTAYHDGEPSGPFSYQHQTLQTGNAFSYWGAEDCRYPFTGKQRALVLIKGKACQVNEIQDIMSFTASSIPYGVQHNIAPATITAGLTCYTHYNARYNHGTRSADVKAYAVGASPYTYVIVGARNGASGQFLLAAVGEYDAVFAATSSQNMAYENNGAYWYYYSPKSMGFASGPAVVLGSADVQDSPSPEDRLSWHLDQRSGGYRVGTVKELNNNADYYKVVMYCN